MKRFSIRGFTLTETLIAMGITSVVVLAVILALAAGGKTRQFIKAQADMEEEALRLGKELRVLADEMVRVNGATQSKLLTAVSGLPSIKRYPDAEPTNLATDSDGFEMVTAVAGAMAVPVTYSTASRNFKISKPTDDMGLQVFNLMKDLADSTSVVPYFILSNQENLNILPNPKARLNEVTDSFEINPGNDFYTQLGSNSKQFESGFSTITPARIVRVEKDGSRLKVTSSPDLGQGVRYIGEQIDRIQLRYTFYKFDANRNITLPAAPLPRWNTPYSVGTLTCGLTGRDARCVTPADVGGLEFSVKLKSSATFTDDTLKMLGGDNSRWSIEDGHLVLNAKIKIYPKNLWAGSKIPASGAINPTCETGNLRPYRCQETCAYKFTNNPSPAIDNPDVAPQDWIGFKAGSPYCDCITEASGTMKLKANDGPFEDWMMPNRPDHQWADSSGNPNTVGQRKLRACFEAYGCNYWRWSMNYGLAGNSGGEKVSPQYQNPEAILACRCINSNMANQIKSGTNWIAGSTPVGVKAYKFGPSATGKYDSLSIWQIVGPLVPGDSANGTGDAWISADQDRNIICDGYFTNYPNTCLAYAKAVSTAAPFGTSGGKAVDAWSTCNCRSAWWDPLFLPSVLGSPREPTSNPKDRPRMWQVTWNNVCNHDFENTSAITCGNTGMVDDGKLVYKRRDVSTSDDRYDEYGLTIRDEQLCRCQRTSGQRGWDKPSFKQTAGGTFDLNQLTTLGVPQTESYIYRSSNNEPSSRKDKAPSDLGDFNCAEFMCSIYGEINGQDDIGDTDCCVPGGLAFDQYDVPEATFNTKLAAFQAARAAAGKPLQTPVANAAKYRQFCFMSSNLSSPQVSPYPNPSPSPGGYIKRPPTSVTAGYKGRRCIAPSNWGENGIDQVKNSILKIFGAPDLDNVPDWCGGNIPTTASGGAYGY